MHIFLTGATGYIGSAIARELIDAGHRVVGLARSDEAARKLIEHHVHPYRGDLMDRSSILAAARPADAAIHAGSPGEEDNRQADEIMITAILDVFRETGKCFLYTSGMWVMGETGPVPMDEDAPLNPLEMVAWRAGVERRVLHFEEHGMRTVVIRPGIVYGHGKGIPAMMRPRADGAVPCVGDGSNHWPVVDVDDLARLYRLVVENATASGVFLAVSENVLVRDVAEAMCEGQRARCIETIPLDRAQERLGFLADGLVLDQLATSERAMRVLGWVPHAPSLLDDLRCGSYIR
jgi:nucleoside-diphosphate-sugar epimerase